jgi:hypothetical protein
MESPLSFNSSENFRKKLLVRNLKPYKVENAFTTNDNVAKQEFQVKDFSVIDSPTIEDIGNNQEAILFPLNKYGPQNTNQTYGEIVNINLNLNNQSNFGEYDYSDTINSKLEQIGNNQELSLIVKNLYKPTTIFGDFGNTRWSINNDLVINSTGDVAGESGYDIQDAYLSRLGIIGNSQELSLIIKNIYKPQTSSGDFGDTRWSINNDLIINTTGDGEYNIQDAYVSRLNIIGNQQEIFLKTKNIYKNTGSDFGNTLWSINDDLVITTTGTGTYGDLGDIENNILEQTGNFYEILLRTKNKYTPASGNDYGNTKWTINNDLILGSNQGEYDFSDSIGSVLEVNGNVERNLLFPLNQYGPEGQQSTQTANPNVNLQTFSNEGNYDFNDSIGSQLQVDGENLLNFQINKYGPQNGPQYATDDNVFVSLGTFIGEYDVSDTNGSQLETVGTVEANDAYVINKYVPGDGSYDIISAIPDVQVLTTGQQYYNSAQSFVFVPSEYSPIQILTSDDPSGSNGSLSQDSALANIAAKQLQKEFKFRIASELLSETIGRVNLLESTIDPDSGEVSVKPNLDPFNAIGIASGAIPLFQRNYRVTAPDLAIGKVINFASKLAGLYSPVSIIPDEYFDYPKPRLLNQVLENPVALLGDTVMGAIRSITSTNIRRGSDLFLAYTSVATRDLLWGQIFYNEYRPDYRANSLRNPNLFSPKPNYYIGDRKNTIIDIVSPVKDLPVYKDNKPFEISVYGFDEVAKDYEGEKLSQIFFGLNTRNFYDGNNSITSNFSWTTKKSLFQPGRSAGPGGQQFDTGSVFDANIKRQFDDSQSFNNKFKEGSILDITQKIVDSGTRSGVKKLQHVGNAINQVTKVFNDGTREITKGSRVIKYVTKNSIDTNGQEFKGLEYCRIFTKDAPYLNYSQLQKSDGNIRKFGYSVFDRTYNLNIAPMNDKNGQSSNIVDGKVKKYMFSLENLAWRTSNKPGFTYDDLPACEKGPNGGRIMWFPPYDLTFDDTTKADFNSVDFIGRPEQVYTYKNSSRSGNISWTILVDHPSVSNLLIDQELKNISPESEITKIMDSFYAGCLKYDIYELAKKYVQFSPNEIQEFVNQVTNKEDAKKVADSTNPSTTTGSDETSDLDELNDKNKEYFMFFENALPGGGGSETTNDFKYWYDQYMANENNYNTQAEGTIFKYSKTKNPNYKDPGPDTPTDIANFSLKEYIDTRQPSIQTMFDRAKESLSTLDNLLSKIAKVLDSGGEVSLDLIGTASSTGGSGFNSNLSSRRIDSVKKSIFNYIINEKKLETYYNKTLKIKEKPLGESANNLKDEKLSDIDCSLKFVNEQSAEGIYSVQAMACRRVKISNIKVKLKEKPKNQEEINEGSLPQEGNVNNQTITPASSATSVKDTDLVKGMTKKLIRKLLSECNYFEMLQENDPFIYDGIKKRFKHFQPAFHSITPEGLNARLTFLQQCMRPGDTIPTVTKSSTGVLGLDYKDAFNSAFGSPPVLVLRIGDFFNTKIIPDNLSIKFDKDGLYDMNPEGIGIQPMYATISLSFKFIGGSGLAGPIAKLQNALSFNYYANTEMYDERAEETDTSIEKYDAEFIEAAKLNTPTKPDNKPTNDFGIPFGEYNEQTTNPDGSQSGIINYKKRMDDFITTTQNYTTKVYQNLRKISETTSLGGLYIINADRKYQEGYFDNLASPNTYLANIYGKPEKYQDKIDSLFSKLKDDIENENIPLLASLTQFNAPNTQKNKIKKQLKSMSDEKKGTYLTDIDTNVTSLLSAEKDNVGNKLVSEIDILNLITNITDGFSNKSNKVILFNLTGTTDVDPSESYANTSLELKGDFLKIKDDLIEFNSKLTEYGIVTNTGNKKWQDDFKFDLGIGPNATEYDNRLNMVFGLDIANDVNVFIDKIVEVLNDSDKPAWKTYLSDNLGVSSTDGIYPTYIKQKNDVKEKFDKFNNEYFNNKFVQGGYNPFTKGKKRTFNFSTQTPLNQTSVDYFNDLKTDGDNGEQNKYNLKKKFK